MRNYNLRVSRYLAMSRLLLVSSAARAADVTDRLTRTIALRPGAGVRIDATIAELTITGSNRLDVQIEIVRRAPSAADLQKDPTLIDDPANACILP